MPAIGRRSTKPLNDPPRRTGATATLFQSRKSSSSSSPSSRPSFLPPRFRADSRCEITPFFGINGRPMYRATIAPMVMQSRVASDVSYIPPSSPDFAIAGRTRTFRQNFYALPREQIATNHFVGLLFVQLDDSFLLLVLVAFCQVDKSDARVIVCLSLMIITT